ncbi:MAG: hypothetical protein COB37_04865 [Kordiimonadales bacterium]|nr:MAG: hypothetical protein COB37_04865 [Kordiimonadales bacterium]
MTESNKCILIVEDNPVLARILGLILEKVPLEYDVVTDGESAISAAKAKPYGAVLMDIMLPKMDGMQATKEIRSLSDQTAKMPIIAVTGRISQHSEQEYRDAGLTDVIKKPVNTSNLLALLSHHISTDEDAGAITEAKGWSGKDTFDVKELDQVNFTTVAEYHSILEDDFLPLLDKYLAAGGDVLSELCNSIGLNDAEKVEFIAHKFKSTSLVFGAERVSHLAAQIEIMGRRKHLAEAGETLGELSWQLDLAQVVLQKKADEIRS